jgi:hypothetical protein
MVVIECDLRLNRSECEEMHEWFVACAAAGVILVPAGLKLAAVVPRCEDVNVVAARRSDVNGTPVDRCVCCGKIIPEGRIVCPNCGIGTQVLAMAKED